MEEGGANPSLSPLSHYWERGLGGEGRILGATLRRSDGHAFSDWQLKLIGAMPGAYPHLLVPQ